MDDACRFRYPAAVDVLEGQRCPRCDGLTEEIGGPFDGRSASRTTQHAGPLVEALLDNVRSGHNVGSIFRSCDGAGVRHVHLCGITATPKHGRVAKAALGAESSVPWSYHRNSIDALEEYKLQGFEVWTLENREPAESLFDLEPELLVAPTILVVGNELAGVDPGILALSDRIFSLPMSGHKSSLNVAVAFGIVAYWLRYGINPLREGS